MKMITAKGYKAFHGKMLIQLAPSVKDVAPFIEGPHDWIYNPKTDMWYSDYHSYSGNVTTPLFDDWKDEKTS